MEYHFFRGTFVKIKIINLCKFSFNIIYRFANKKAFVIFYGLVGCIYTATYAYFNGTITTLEKRFKIPSKTSGEVIVLSNKVQGD